MDSMFIDMSKSVETICIEAATQEEKEKFQNLWMRKIKTIIVDKKGINDWLKLEEGRNKNE